MTIDHPAATAAAKIKSGALAVGYWSVLDSPISTERIALSGYDYVAIDAQHGLVGYSGVLDSLIAVDAAAGPAGLVRVEANDPAAIGKALDAGARGVIVPLVDSAEDAERAVRATRYPPRGDRSYGPMRSGLRVGPVPQQADASVLLMVMIETRRGLENVEEICDVDGIDGVYIGPSDLTLALGGRTTNDPDVAGEVDAARNRILRSARSAGVVAGIHTPDGQTARRRIEEGFSMVTIASDLVHLQQAAQHHLAVARGTEPT